MSKTALIFGISGQDGSLLAKFLIHQGYTVIGQTRNKDNAVKNLKALMIFNQVELRECSMLDKESLFELVHSVAPDEIYNLSGQSSVGYSFDQPEETFESQVVVVSHVLEIIRTSAPSIKFFNAGSGECFGHSDIALNINAALNPSSPYGVAKASSLLMVGNYRQVYHMYACTGVLFNHESPLRHDRFVTKKVIKAAYRIYKGDQDCLQLGNLDVVRDWGWAEEYIEAMWLMLQQEHADDMIIATGEKNSLQDFVAYAFERYGLNWKDYVVLNNDFIRPFEIPTSYGDTQRTHDKLNWKASYNMRDVVDRMAKIEEGNYV